MARTVPSNLFIAALVLFILLGLGFFTAGNALAAGGSLVLEISSKTEEVNRSRRFLICREGEQYTYTDLASAPYQAKVTVQCLTDQVAKVEAILDKEGEDRTTAIWEIYPDTIPQTLILKESVLEVRVAQRRSE